MKMKFDTSYYCLFTLWLVHPEQSCLVRVGGVNKSLVANRKLGRDETKLIETGSRQDKTVLSMV